MYKISEREELYIDGCMKAGVEQQAAAVHIHET